MVERIKLLDEGKTLQIEYTMTDPEELERRMEEHEALDARGLQRHLRSRVPAEPEQGSAQHRYLGGQVMRIRKRCSLGCVVSSAARCSPITPSRCSIRRRT